MKLFVNIDSVLDVQIISYLILQLLPMLINTEIGRIGQVEIIDILRQNKGQLVRPWSMCRIATKPHQEE